LSWRSCSVSVACFPKGKRIANLLDLETTSLGELKNLEMLAQLKERVAMLEAVILKNGLTVPELPEEK
jgi:hypothetical protein